MATQSSTTGQKTGQRSKQGDTYRCKSCGMEVRISKEGSAGCSPSMSCCGQPMQKA
jgi:Desulfoferrodoxin, N-terminal domain